MSSPFNRASGGAAPPPPSSAPSTPYNDENDGDTLNTPHRPQNQNRNSAKRGSQSIFAANLGVRTSELSSPMQLSSPMPATGDARTPATLGMRSPWTGTPLRNSSSANNQSQNVTPRRGDIRPSQELNRFLASQAMSPLPEGEENMEVTGQENDGNETATDAPQTVRMIWGTTIKIHQTVRMFVDFLQHFTVAHMRKYEASLAKRAEGTAKSDHNAQDMELSETASLASVESNDLDEELTENDRRPYYPLYIRKVVELEQSNVINLDANHLRAYRGAEELYWHLRKYPVEIIPLMDQLLEEYVSTQMQIQVPNSNNGESSGGLRVRPYNIGASVNMRELDPRDLDKLVCVKGLVTRTSAVTPDMRQAYFQCPACDDVQLVPVEQGKIEEPTKCARENCASAAMELIHVRCDFSDKQMIRLQETPDSVPAGQTPHTVTLWAYDDLHDKVRPGDKVEVTGIYRASTMRVNPRQRNIKNIFKTYLDVVHIQTIKSGQLTSREQYFVADEEKGNELEFSPSEVREFQALAEREDIFELLTKSLAPNIYELDDVKKGVMLQLFGATTKTFKKSASNKARGDINILLVGDPGTSKSQLLQYVYKVAPRGMYTSGKGSSAVGLTAYVSRDPESRQLVLESGALVLSDGGICCIDEFDKMSEGTRSVLHEAMEQQTISVAKAGIVATLNARTSILAAANPIGSQWNANLTISANLNMPPSLVSRFDLTYLIIDTIDEKFDRKLARHLLSMYFNHAQRSDPNLLKFDTLSRYIGYARKNCSPILSEESAKQLVDYYVDMRRAGGAGNRKAVGATTRQLEGMIRLSEAHARMRLSEVVEPVDVAEAVRLVKVALASSATDPRTGLIDVDLLATGQSAMDRQQKKDAAKALENVLQRLWTETQSNSARYKAAFQKFNEESQEKINEEFFRTILHELEASEKVTINVANRNYEAATIIRSK